MKYLKLNPQHYVRYDAITEVLTQGKEGHVVQVFVVASGKQLTYKYCKNFAEAEQVVRDLVLALEYNAGAQLLYGSDSQQATTEGR